MNSTYDGMNSTHLT